MAMAFSVGRLAGVLLAALSLGAGPAASPRLTQVVAPAVEVRWADGLIVARGQGLADRRAPSVSAAQAAARRRAEDGARTALVAALRSVPGAPADATAAGAFVQAAELATDGSWRVELALPVAALRPARVVDAAADDRGDVTAVVIDARRLTVAPSAAFALGGAAVLWRTSEPPPAVLGDRVERRVATAVTADGFTLDGAVLDPALIDSALVVVLVAREAP